MKALLIFTLVSFLAFTRGYAQEKSIVSITGLPTKEVYDLHVDKKGFLWIGHDLGLSRFDGTTMTHFSSSAQTTLSISDLLEDQTGRIWCHDFSGKIFYVENEKMLLLKEYDHKIETKFPRMQIVAGELIATSSQGLFIYNIAQKRSKYIPLKHGTSSLTSYGNHTVLYGGGEWYLYDKKQGASKLKLFGENIADNSTTYLHPLTHNDTLIVSNTLKGILKKFVVKKDSIILTETLKTGDFINTISKYKNSIWVNTKTNSYDLKTQSNSYKNLDLTDITQDNEGNTWLSSLKEGLMVIYAHPIFKKTNLITVSPKDFVRCLIRKGDLIAFGTQNGELIVYNSKFKKVTLRKKFSEGGAIEKISNYLNETLLISTSVGNWRLNVETNEIKLLDKTTLKDIDIHEGNVFYATSESLTLKPAINNSSFSLLKPIVSHFTDNFNSDQPIVIRKARSKIVKYHPLHHEIYTSVNDKLYRINKKGTFPVLFKNIDINVSSLATSKNNVFAGDYAKGIFIITKNSIKNITINNGLLSNTILKLKLFNHHLWINHQKGLQLFDVNTGKINNDFYLPNFEQGTIFDVLETDKSLFIASSEGLFEFDLNQIGEKLLIKNYILNVLVNNKDTLATNKSLPHDKNNLQFYLSIPIYNNAENIYFKYRLKSSSHKDWFVTSPGQRSINYLALVPDDYIFEVVAITRTGMVLSSLIKFDFSISKPWWQQLWFILTATGVVLIVFWLIIRAYYMLSLRKERSEYEKLFAVQTERNRIGEDIHDDISAGLSSLKLQASLLENKADGELKHEIAKIYTKISRLSSHLREVIWTLNSENDSLESLIFYLQQQANSLFEDTNINLQVQLPSSNIPNIVINGGYRRNIYLAQNEALQNVIKHSNATLAHLTIALESDLFLKIIVVDNGTGFLKSASIEGFGMKTMKRRISAIGGTIETNSFQGFVVSFSIPLTKN